MPDVVMPRLSDSMQEGTVLRWLKQPGDEITVGDELVEIETDKANMVYESDVAGTLVEIVAAEGDTIPIGKVIAKVGDASNVESDGTGAPDAIAEGSGATDVGQGTAEGAGPSALLAADTAAPQRPVEGAAGPSATKSVAAAPSGGAPTASGERGAKASPIARRIARERGLDLHALSGSGPGGRIVKADVEKALTSGGPAPGLAPPAPAGSTHDAKQKPETAKGQVQIVELTKLQQTVARRMAESKATVPHFQLQAEIDMTAAVEAREKLKEMAADGEVMPTFNDMIVKACALALREHPRANGAYRDGRIELYSRVNVGVAVAAREALVVPTVFDADLKGLRQIAAETRALASRVRDGQITPPELSGATFTVSNLGMYGISTFHAVINTPQAAILAIGELKVKPVVKAAGWVEPGQMMGVTLACDHRILYGADGAILLGRVRELLEDPIGLAL